MTTNFYSKIPNVEKEHNPGYGVSHMLKVPFRMLILGMSGGGKTNTLLDMIDRMKNTFTHIILCTRDAHEPLYIHLKNKLKDGLTIYEGTIPVPDNKRGAVMPNVPDLDTISRQEQTLVIFDDLVLAKNSNRISEYFIRGRKKNVSMVYLSQSYFKAPKIIRLQCNYIIFKQVNNINDLNAILRETTLPYKLEDLRKMYHLCIKQFSDFLLIDSGSGCCYHSFSLTPIGQEKSVTSMMKEEEEKISAPAPPKVTKKAKIVDRYPDRLEQEKQSAHLFAGRLEEDDKYCGLYFGPDLYELYVSWCEPLNMRVGSMRCWHHAMNDYFENKTIRGKKSYYINCDPNDC